MEMKIVIFNGVEFINKSFYDKAVAALRDISDLDNIDREDPVRTAYDTLKGLGEIEPTAEGEK